MTEPKQKPGRSKQDYGTPPEFLTAVKRRLGIAEFDCDLAARADNAVCPVFISPEEDSLTQPWKRGSGGWNWLNPPFADIAPWARRCYEQAAECHARTAMLIPAAVGANYWREWVHEKADVLLLNGRIKFVGCEDYYPKDCVLLLYSPLSIATRGYYDVWNWREPPPAADAVRLSMDEPVVSIRDERSLSLFSDLSSPREAGSR